MFKHCLGFRIRFVKLRVGSRISKDTEHIRMLPNRSEMRLPFILMSRVSFQNRNFFQFSILKFELYNHTVIMHTSNNLRMNKISIQHKYPLSNYVESTWKCHPAR